MVSNLFFGTLRLTNSIRALSVYFPRDCIRQVAGLLDHLIRQDEERWRYRDPERLGGLEVDDQLEFHGLLHRQVRRLGAFEDLVHQARGAFEAAWQLLSIA